MIDLETHRVTYLINSRELKDVKEWLKTYKNLQLVSRDGSIVYKKAITLSHPLAIQVSDRFHILKNLTDYCKEYLKNKFDNNVVIKEKVVINNELKRFELSNRAKQLHNDNYSITKIAEILSIDRRTVRKYLAPDYSPTDARYGKEKKSKLDPHKKTILKLYNKNLSSRVIYNIITEQGYTGSSSNLRRYCSKLKKSMNNESRREIKEKIEIERNKLLKLLYNPLNKTNIISEDDFNKVKSKYPFFNEILSLIVKFKKILKNKEVDKLNEWITNAKMLNNQYINSFINGITRDIEAIKNAIIYDYNNGLAEGSINKLKVIKRIMYGRSSFQMLRRNLLLIESRK